MSIKSTFLYVTIIATFIIIFSGCANTKSENVVIYTSVDQVFSEPVLEERWVPID